MVLLTRRRREDAPSRLVAGPLTPATVWVKGRVLAPMPGQPELQRDMVAWNVQFARPPQHVKFFYGPKDFDVLGAVEDDILDCFRNGGGVPYQRFPRFHEVMAEDSGQSVLSALESHIIPLVPGLAEKLTGGIHMLDVGCGRGEFLELLREAGVASYGVDLDPEMAAYVEQRLRERGAEGVRPLESVELGHLLQIGLPLRGLLRPLHRCVKTQIHRHRRRGCRWRRAGRCQRRPPPS